MGTLFLHFMISHSLPLVWYNITSTEQVFLTHSYETLQAALETPLTSSSHMKQILLDVSWDLQTTRSQAMPNPGCSEGLEQLQIQYPHHHWSGSISVRSGVIYHIKNQKLFPPNKRDWLFQLLLGFCICPGVGFLPLSTYYWWMMPL